MHGNACFFLSAFCVFVLYFYISLSFHSFNFDG
jgi:hypothetical protein